MKLRTLAAPVMLALFVLISPAWAQNSATNKGKDITSLDLGSLQQLAEVGDVSAQMEMAARYFEGKGGVVKDRVQALVWWHKAADRGEAKAKFFIGMMYELGSGVPKDDAQAFAWYLKAAQQGYAMGERQKTGYGYLHGLGVERDYTQALSWYQKAVVHGFAAAEYYLGYMYSNGLGVPKDYVTTQTHIWFYKARRRCCLIQPDEISENLNIGRGRRSACCSRDSQTPVLQGLSNSCRMEPFSKS